MRFLWTLALVAVLLSGCQYARVSVEPPPSPSSTPNQTRQPDPTPAVEWRTLAAEWPLFVSTVDGESAEVSPTSVELSEGDVAVLAGGGPVFNIFSGSGSDPLLDRIFVGSMRTATSGVGLLAVAGTAEEMNRQSDGMVAVTYVLPAEINGQFVVWKYEFFVREVGLPAPDVEGLSVRQGEVLIFSWDGQFAPNWVLVDGRTGEELPVYEDDAGVSFSLLATRATTSADRYSLIIRRRETETGELTELGRYDYNVVARTFDRQDLTVSSGLASLNTAANAESDSVKTAAAKAESAPEKLWSGAFIEPLTGRISTQFGQMRYTNGRFSSYHSGVDIAAAADTPVAAVADGIVTMADELVISGNTVIVDHGWGVFSGYSHLNAFRCSPGDVVKAGDVLGLVGSTGYSTGPHLHYTVTVGGVYVDPACFE